MVDRHVYKFDDFSATSLDLMAIARLPNDRQKGSIGYLAETIIELFSKDTEKKKIRDRGYVVAINGAWGVGKTTATWAAINAVRAQIGNSNLVMLSPRQSSFLPFGGTTAAIQSYLVKLAAAIERVADIDVSRELAGALLDLTPSNATKLNVGLQMGPLSVGKPFTDNTRYTDAQLRAKMQRLVDRGKYVLLVIDDLDRLAPQEVVDSLRLVERLRSMPGVLIILPLYRRIIRRALVDALSLDDTDAFTFMRKLIDHEVTIENDLESFKHHFGELFTESPIITEKFDKEVLAMDGGITAFDLCLRTVLHNIILEEASVHMRSGENLTPSPQAVQDTFSGLYSEYLAKLHQAFVMSRDGTGAPLWIVDNQPDGRQLLKRLGRVYPNLADLTSNSEAVVSQWSDLTSRDMVFKPIYTDPSLQDVTPDQLEYEFDTLSSAQQATTRPLYAVLMNAILANTQAEKGVTDNYRAREARALARAIIGDDRVNTLDTDVARGLYTLAQNAFQALRTQ